VSEAVTVPSVSFTVVDARSVTEAAVPTLAFRLRVTAGAGDDVRAIVLSTQVRIAVARRPHDAATRVRLSELFGNQEQWSSSALSLLWTHASVTVPPFAGETIIEVPIACTSDMEMAVAKYVHALGEGEIPLDFLFSGGVFYADAQGALQTCRIAWDREARFAVPVSMWKEMLERYYPDSVWLRLDRASFDRLHAWKARQALPSWPMAIDALLRAAEAGRRA
jgi:hypothetical protein